MNQTMIWFNLQSDGTGNGFSNSNDTFAESLQLQMSVPHQLQGWSLKLVDSWAKYKEKVHDVSYSNPNIEITCSSKLKSTELKDLFIKRVQKN